VFFRALRAIRLDLTIPPPSHCGEQNESESRERVFEAATGQMTSAKRQPPGRPGRVDANLRCAIAQRGISRRSSPDSGFGPGRNALAFRHHDDPHPGHCWFRRHRLLTDSRSALRTTDAIWRKMSLSERPVELCRPHQRSVDRRQIWDDPRLCH
jgi:hypothetical protein